MELGGGFGIERKFHEIYRRKKTVDANQIYNHGMLTIPHITNVTHISVYKECLNNKCVPFPYIGQNVDCYWNEIQLEASNNNNNNSNISNKSSRHDTECVLRCSECQLDLAIRSETLFKRSISNCYSLQRCRQSDIEYENDLNCMTCANRTNPIIDNSDAKAQGEICLLRPSVITLSQEDKQCFRLPCNSLKFSNRNTKTDTIKTELNDRNEINCKSTLELNSTRQSKPTNGFHNDPHWTCKKKEKRVRLSRNSNMLSLVGALARYLTVFLLVSNGAASAKETELINQICEYCKMTITSY